MGFMTKNDEYDELHRGVVPMARIFNAVRALKLRSPTMRIGQIIEIGLRFTKAGSAQLFTVEDDELASALEAFLDDGG